MTRLTTLDLPSFYKATVGFDNMFEDMEKAFANQSSGGYPPYNIVQLADNEYVISLAVAGFSMEDLELTKEKNQLQITGSSPKGDENVKYLYKGIGGRSFRREFALAEHIDVMSANLENGMLNIHLKRTVPEELQPKKIEIQNGATVTIESK